MSLHQKQALKSTSVSHGSSTHSPYAHPLPWPGNEVCRLFRFHVFHFWLMHWPSLSAIQYYFSKSDPDSRANVFNKQ